MLWEPDILHDGADSWAELSTLLKGEVQGLLLTGAFICPAVPQGLDSVRTNVLGLKFW